MESHDEYVRSVVIAERYYRCLAVNDGCGREKQVMSALMIERCCVRYSQVSVALVCSINTFNHLFVL